MHYIAIFLGGGFGSLCRFALSKWNPSDLILPYGTMAANFLSCIVLGFVTVYLLDKADAPTAIRPFFAIGFCGGFSTFSTFSLETFKLLKAGAFAYALINVLVSVVICLVALYIGMKLYEAFII